MSHVFRNRKKLGLRVARIRGQMDAVARALEEGDDCSEVLRLIASARGAMNGLMAEVLADHLRHHSEAADEVIEVIRSYLK